MADTGLRRKVGPLPVYGWAAAGGGTYLVYYLYRRHAANVAGAAATGTTGGGTAAAPAVTAVYAVGPSNTPTGGSTASLTTWRNTVLAQLTNPRGGNISLAQATIVLNDYLAGHPIPYEYRNAAAALQNVLSNVGIAPGLPFRNVSIAAPLPGVTKTHTPSEKVTTPTIPTLPNRSNVPGARAASTPVDRRGGPVVAQRAADATRNAYQTAQALLFPKNPPKNYKPPKNRPGVIGPPPSSATYPAKGHPSREVVPTPPAPPITDAIPGFNLVNDFFGSLFG